MLLVLIAMCFEFIAEQIVNFRADSDVL